MAETSELMSSDSKSKSTCEAVLLLLSPVEIVAVVVVLLPSWVPAVTVDGSWRVWPTYPSPQET